MTDTVGIVQPPPPVEEPEGWLVIYRRPGGNKTWCTSTEIASYALALTVQRNLTTDGFENRLVRITSLPAPALPEVPVEDIRSMIEAWRGVGYSTTTANRVRKFLSAVEQQKKGGGDAKG